VTDPVADTVTLAELADARAVAPRESHDPEWLTTLRATSVDYVAEHGYPTRKLEDWRYVRLEKLLATEFVTPPAGPSDVAADDAIVKPLLARVPDLGGTRIVFVDGRFAPAVSRLVPVDGLRVAQLSAALAPDASSTGEDLVGDDLIGADPQHAFDALNMALTSAGVHITVADGAVIDAPVHVIHVFTGRGEPVLANLRHPVRIGENAQMTLVTSAFGAPGALGCLNVTTRARLGAGATLHHRDLQNQPVTAFHLSLLDVTQEANSELDGFVSALGAAIARHEVHVRQVGVDANTHIDGLYVPRGEQQHDHPILIEHFAEGGVSREIYRGVIDDRGHGVFNGQIVIHPGAQRIDSDQSNKNLLLSDTAEADTRPRLLIYADDVKATHGASVGRLDDEQLFYLRSRGIPDAEARRVLTYAFVAEIVETISQGPLHDHVAALVSARLHPDEDTRHAAEVLAETVPGIEPEDVR
jgi:Fe-S cluster assembly protein SufD